MNLTKKKMDINETETSTFWGETEPKLVLTLTFSL